MVEENNQRILKCKASTDSNKLAGSIHSAYKEDSGVPLIIRVIGAGSLNQAMKAVIISNKYFIKKGIVVCVQPSFQDAGENMTAIELKLLFQKI